MEEYMKKYDQWCKNENINDETKKELLSIKDNEEEIKDRFYKNLEFGTAGLRGVLGNGTNRMNIYTVGKATQGLANYIKKQGKQNEGVVIGFDSRHMSKEFGEYTANCLNANGIKTYIFEELRPVPEISFAIRKLKCISGIAITASHNPPKYNGYKAYWSDGAQLSDEQAPEIMEEINRITDYSLIKTMDKQEAINKELYNIVGKEIDDQYIETIKKLVLNQDIIKMQNDIKIVYTPLHGAGRVLVKRILEELGFKNVYIVKDQEMPDGDFPTVEYPNPEDKRAFKMALELAKEKDADIVLATDPDADRLGIYAKDIKTGEYIPFTGNMSALLILEYLLSEKSKQGILPQKGYVIKSIVSSRLTESICKAYNVQLFSVLTGFKNIGEKIKEQEEKTNNEYIFSFEESYGCLPGEYARDKDGIAAVMTLCEAAAYYKNQGLTLYDQMIKIYEKYGYYKEDAVSVTMEGIEGAERIKEIMTNIRNNPLRTIGESKVCSITDYKLGETKDLIENETVKEKLPNSNVLYYKLENNEWCAIRPSGTEPKIKAYVGVVGTSLEEAEERVNTIKDKIKDILK